MKKTSVLLVLLSLISLVFYQNCGLELGELDGEKGKGTSDGIPFPVKVNIDLIAHTSCLMDYNGNTHSNYFTFKAVASKPELKRSAAFDAFIETKSGDVSNNRYKYLKQSNKLSNLTMRFSLKKPGEMLSHSFFNDSRIKDYEQFNHISFTDTDAYGDYPVLLKLAYFGSASILSGAPSASLDLRFPLNDDLFEGHGSGRYLNLTLDYAKTNDDQMLSLAPITYGEGNRMDRIFGNHYKVYMAGEKVTHIREYDAEYGTPPVAEKQFSCVPYIIVKPGDPFTAACGDASVGTPIQENSSNPEISRLFKVLSNGWKLYTNNTPDGSKCLVNLNATNKGCYLDNYNQNPDVEYNRIQPCGGNGQPLCARYLSLCSKQP